MPIPSSEAAPARLVVLVSGSGTNLQALLDAAADPAYGAQVVAVGADRDGIEGLARAERAGRADVRAPGQGLRGPRAPGTARSPRRSPSTEPDLVVSAGFMKLVGAAFLTAFGGRFVNTHPALCAVVPRACTAPPTRWRTASRSPAARCSSSTTASTPARSWPRPRSAVEDDDTVDSLHERIKVAERALLVDTVGAMAREGFTIEDRKVRLG